MTGRTGKRLDVDSGHVLIVGSEKEGIESGRSFVNSKHYRTSVEWS